jgi:hypothetical protein
LSCFVEADLFDWSEEEEEDDALDSREFNATRAAWSSTNWLSKRWW